MKTTSLTVRKCPVALHAALKNRAKAHRRTLNAETLEVLASAVGNGRRLSETELRRQLRSIPSKARLSLAETRAAIREGRQ